MTNNYKRTKEWLDLAFKNIERVLKYYKDNDYADTVFKIQLSIEQLQKALIFLLGMQFRKTHDPSEILETIEYNNSIKIEKKKIEQIKKIAALAKDIEGEGATTRYGIIKNDELITPEDKYDNIIVNKFLNDLKDVLINIYELLKEIPDLEHELIKLLDFIKNFRDLLKK